jgi:ABC-type sugar transport system substrate-binding protein
VDQPINRRKALLAFAHAGLLCMTRSVFASSASPRVVFLNPGEANERGTGQHWQLVPQFMQVAAKTFGMQLEVLYAERDHLLMLRQAKEVAERANPPDYVVIVNEKMAADQMLMTLARSSAKVLLIHNDLTPGQRLTVGNERERIRNWIGTVTADSSHAGYLLMQYLYQRAGSGGARVIGITGDPNTPVSLERAEGVEAFLSHVPDGRTCQLVFSDWSYADGVQKARVLLARYPQANVIWAANDSMALGAVKAVEERHAHVLVGSMGTSQEALLRLANGGLAATMGGGDFIGALGMVLLYDYHQGRDFAAAGGVRQKLDFQGVITEKNAAEYHDAVFVHAQSLNFGLYSKALHPAPGLYDFGLQRLLNNVPAPS